MDLLCFNYEPVGTNQLDEYINSLQIWIKEQMWTYQLGLQNHNFEELSKLSSDEGWKMELDFCNQIYEYFLNFQISFGLYAIFLLCNHESQLHRVIFPLQAWLMVAKRWMLSHFPRNITFYQIIKILYIMMSSLENVNKIYFFEIFKFFIIKNKSR